MIPAPGARRTTAHDHRQLAEALGWTVTQVGKAVILGVLPPYDLKTPRWKAATVEERAIADVLYAAGFTVTLQPPLRDADPHEDRGAKVIVTAAPRIRVWAIG